MYTPFPDESCSPNSILLNMSSKANNLAENRPKPTDLSQSQLPADAALALHQLGLNVLPMPYGQKAGFPWTLLQYQRLPENMIELVFRGRCNVAVIPGKTSSNLYVIDCETQEALDFHMRHMRENGIPLWVVRTARGGHIWMFSATGEVKSIPTGTLLNAEIKGGSNGYVLCPPSRHPDGPFYEWIIQEGDSPPIVDVQRITWLKDNQGKAIALNAKPSTVNSGEIKTRDLKKLSNYPQPASNLSRQTRDYLANGHVLTQGTRNNRLFSAACDMLGCEFPPDIVETTLFSIAETSGLRRTAIRATLSSAQKQPRKSARAYYEKPTKVVHWQLAHFYIQSCEWQGRTGTTDYKVALAFVKRAKYEIWHEEHFRASYRELAQLAGISLKTLQKSLKRMAAQVPPIVEYIGALEPTGASVWKFHPEVIKRGNEIYKSSTVTLQPGGEDIVLLLYTPTGLSTDAGERGALGANGLRIYYHMLNLGQPTSVNELVTLLGLKRTQVVYALGKLEKYKLAFKANGRWELMDPNGVDLDDWVSEPAGTLGKGRKRQERFAKERIMYAVSRLVYRRRNSDLGFKMLPWRCGDCGQINWLRPNEYVALLRCEHCGCIQTEYLQLAGD